MIDLGDCHLLAVTRFVLAPYRPGVGANACQAEAEDEKAAARNARSIASDIALAGVVETALALVWQGLVAAKLQHGSAVGYSSWDGVALLLLPKWKDSN